MKFDEFYLIARRIGEINWMQMWTGIENGKSYSTNVYENNMKRAFSFRP